MDRVSAEGEEVISPGGSGARPPRHTGVQGVGHRQALWEHRDSTFWLARADADEVFFSARREELGPLAFLFSVTRAFDQTTSLERPLQYKLCRLEVGDSGRVERPERGLFFAYGRSSWTCDTAKTILFAVTADAPGAVLYSRRNGTVDRGRTLGYSAGAGNSRIMPQEQQEVRKGGLVPPARHVARSSSRRLVSSRGLGAVDVDAPSLPPELGGPVPDRAELFRGADLRLRARASAYCGTELYDSTTRAVGPRRQTTTLKAQYCRRLEVLHGGTGGGPHDFGPEWDACDPTLVFEGVFAWFGWKILTRPAVPAE